MRIKLAQTNSKKRYLVFTTDDARKRAVDPTRLLAYSQPQNRYFRARVEKVGLAQLGRDQASNPVIGFTSLLSGNMSSINARSSTRRWSLSKPLRTARRSMVGFRSRFW